MWDVIWTDPDKELVGEHRARKEKEGDQKRKHSAGSVRSSVSTASSRRSSADSPFSVFRTRCLRRINTSASNAHMASSASSGLESSSIISARSPLSRTFGDSSNRSSGRASVGLFERRTDIDSPDKTKESDGKLSLSLSNNDSIFSASPIGDVTISSSVNDDAMTDAERMKSLMQVLGQSSIADAESTGTKKRCSDGPLTPPMSPTKASPPSVAKSKLESPGVLVPPIKSPLRLVAPKWHLPMMPNNLDAWKPPNQWDPALSKSWTCIPDEQNAAPFLASPSNSGRGVPQDSDSLQAEVLRMATASTPDTLSRLKELWDSTAHWKLQSLLDKGDEVTEKRRWMLSALHHMDRILESTSRRPTPCSQSPMTARMVLALYESSVTVTYLAALYPTKQLYHISPSATSYEEFCNIRTISVSSVSPTDFPVAPRLFESVHSLSLPSLCAQTTLPGILKNVHKCLKTGGAFQLTLIDPLPRAGTMGRKMRAWLENHLLRNLAKEHRCMSPSTLVPPLLGEAGLRGEESTLTLTKFYAMPESATSQENDADCGMQGVRAEREAKAQVRSLVGRMLWVEVWGPYVTASKWWWDVPACVEECLELGTFWEYHAIKGVKG